MLLMKLYKISHCVSFIFRYSYWYKANFASSYILLRIYRFLYSNFCSLEFRSRMQFYLTTFIAHQKHLYFWLATQFKLNMVITRKMFILLVSWAAIDSCLIVLCNNISLVVMNGKIVFQHGTQNIEECYKKVRSNLYWILVQFSEPWIRIKSIKFEYHLFLVQFRRDDGIP